MKYTCNNVTCMKWTEHNRSVLWRTCHVTQSSHYTPLLHLDLSDRRAIRKEKSPMYICMKVFKRFFLPTFDFHKTHVTGGVERWRGGDPSVQCTGGRWSVVTSRRHVSVDWPHLALCNTRERWQWPWGWPLASVHCAAHWLHWLEGSDVNSNYNSRVLLIEYSINTSLTDQNQNW